MDKYHEKLHIPKLHETLYPTYEYSNKIAFLIPLFKSEYVRDGTRFDRDIFLNIHCHGAIWAALSLIHNSDIADNGIPVYFYIEDTVEDEFRVHAKKFRVPEKAIKTFHMHKPERYYDRPLFGKKLAFIDDSELDFETVILWDSDQFLCTPAEPVELYDILNTRIFKEQLIVNSFDYRKHPIHKLILYLHRATGRTDDSHYAIELINNILEQHNLKPINFRTTDKNKPFYIPHIAGDIISYPLQHFRDTKSQLHKFLKSNFRNCYDDEGLITLFCISENINLPSIDNFLDFSRISDQNAIIEHHKRASIRPYLTHIHLTEDEPDRTAEYFKQFIYDLTHNIRR